MLFFEADAGAVEEPPDRSDPRLLLTLIEQTALDFFQCQVGLLPNQSKKPFLMLLQRGPAVALVGFGLKAAALPPALRPADRRRIPNHKLSRSRSCRRAALNNLDHSNPQIVRIPHCRPPQSEKATESYSRLSVNPFDSQKMENALKTDIPTLLSADILTDSHKVYYGILLFTIKSGSWINTDLNWMSALVSTPESPIPYGAPSRRTQAPSPLLGEADALPCEPDIAAAAGRCNKPIMPWLLIRAAPRDTVTHDQQDDLRERTSFKIRVPVSPLWTSMFKAFDAAPASINFSEVY